MIKNITDEEIVRLLQQNQVSPEQKNQYFELLVNKYKDKLYQIVYNYIKDCGTLHDAEEILLSTFTKFWQSINNFKFKSSVYTYIYRIAINLAINFLKSNSRNRLNTIPLEDINHKLHKLDKVQEENDEVFIENKQKDETIQQKVQSAINNLPPKQKLALILAKYENKSYQEIADVMNCSVSSIESLLFRAKQNLKKALTS